MDFFDQVRAARERLIADDLARESAEQDEEQVRATAASQAAELLASAAMLLRDAGVSTDQLLHRLHRRETVARGVYADRAVGSPTVHAWRLDASHSLTTSGQLVRSHPVEVKRGWKWTREQCVCTDGRPSDEAVWPGFSGSVSWETGGGMGTELHSAPLEPWLAEKIAQRLPR